MSLGVLNNINAIYAQGNLASTQTSLSKTLQQLSSGSRINSGADDAAGLSLANGLQASSTALTQSAKNASQGVDFLQVADGALAQVTSLLNRAVTLATESSNGTLNASQTSAANSEYQKILTEVNTINNTTEYNGINSFTTESTVSVGNAKDVISTAGSTGNQLTLSWKDSTGAAQTTTFASSDGSASSDVKLVAGATVSDLATAINNKMGSSVASIQNRQLILTNGATLSGTIKDTNTIKTVNGGTSSAVTTVGVGNSSDTFSSVPSDTYYGGSLSLAAAPDAAKTYANGGGTVATGDYFMTTTTAAGVAAYVKVGNGASVGTDKTAWDAQIAAGPMNGFVTVASDNSISKYGSATVTSAAAGVTGTDSYGNNETAAQNIITLGDGTKVGSAEKTQLAVQVGNGNFAKVATGALGALDTLVAAVNAAAGQSIASIQGNSMVLSGATLNGKISETETVDGSKSNAAAVSIFTSDGTIATLYNNNATDRVKADTTALGLANSSLATAAGAQSALTAINSAITAVAADRGTIGANINTLNSVGNVMTTQSTNTLAAMNDVTATDYAQATSDMSKYQILSQTGIAALSQANQSSQLITKLLQ